MEQLLAVIITWLAVESGLPATQNYPRIELATSAAMETLRREASTTGGPQAGAAGIGSRANPSAGDGVFAVYDDRSRTIYLHEGWNSANPADSSLLVHEMVHHLQNVADVTFACAEEREKDAYRAQRNWLEIFGTTLENEFGIDAMTVMVRTNCMY